jgi:hypothetical protein
MHIGPSSPVIVDHSTNLIEAMSVLIWTNRLASISSLSQSWILQDTTRSIYISYMWRIQWRTWPVYLLHYDNMLISLLDEHLLWSNCLLLCKLFVMPPDGRDMNNVIRSSVMTKWTHLWMCLYVHATHISMLQTYIDKVLNQRDNMARKYRVRGWLHSEST